MREREGGEVEGKDGREGSKVGREVVRPKERESRARRVRDGVGRSIIAVGGARRTRRKVKRRTKEVSSLVSLDVAGEGRERRRTFPSASDNGGSEDDLYNERTISAYSNELALHPSTKLTMFL